MATTIVLQLTTISQEPVTDHPDRKAGTNTPVNANQAQAGTPPEDTVTLSPQSGQTQLSGQNQEQNQQQPTTPTVEIFVAEAVVFGPPNPTNDFAATQNNANRAARPGRTQQNVVPQAGVQEPNAVTTPQVNAPTTVPAAVQSGQTAPSASSQNSQQQELAQLDQVLQQLGFNPDTIGLSNQLAMLAFINDPAALEAFVQTLTAAASQLAPAGGGATAAISAPASAATAAANSSAPATNTASSATQNPAPAAASDTQNAQSSNQQVQGTAVLAEIVITEFPPSQQTNAADRQGKADQNQTAAPPDSNAPAPNNGFVVQFQELQLAFAAGASSGNAAGTSGNAGSGINITI